MDGLKIDKELQSRIGRASRGKPDKDVEKIATEIFVAEAVRSIHEE